MYSGIVLFCDKTSQQKCLSRKLYTCADQKTKPNDNILPGTIVFLYNTEDKTLLGPFTSLEEGGGALDSGAWAMDIDEHSASENVRVTWENLHVIDDVLNKLPFLRNPKKCVLTALQTQRILDLLRDGKPFLEVKNEKSA